MKKIMSLLAVFTLVIALFIPTAFAAGTEVTLEKETAAPGEEVSVDVSITGNTGLAATKISLDYNSDVLSIVGITPVKLANATVNETKGIVTFAAASDVKDDGVLFTVTFAVKENANDGEYPVSVSISKMISSDSVSLDPIVVAGSVTVKTPEAPHEHSYTAKVTEPTCTEKGYTTYTCSCGDSYVDDYVNAKGHSYTATETVAPTCTEKGYTTYTCGVCGDSYKGDYVDATGHRYNVVFNWAKDNTCTATWTCACGASETVKADVKAVSTDATCTKAGTVTYTATVTLGGKTYTDTKTVTGATLPHNYVATFTWAEDYSSASVILECRDCGKKVTVDAKDCVVTSETTPATETSEGKIVYTATVTVDGVTYTDTKTVVLPKLEPSVDDTTKPDDTTKEESPKTGDNSFVFMASVMMLIAVAGLVLMGKKRCTDKR